MAIPAGTQYYVPVTVNYTKVGETAANLLYQIDLSTKLAADSVFKSKISTAANIAVYDPVLDSVRPRRVVLDLSGNKLLIYWDGAASSLANKTFWVCVGSGISQTDSTSAFTNSGVNCFWGMDTGSGSTIYDYADSAPATIQGSGMSLGATGLFGGGLSAANSGYANISTNLNSQLSNKNTLDISMVIKPNNFSASHTFFNIQASSSLRIWAYTNTAVLGFSLCNGGTQTTYVTLANAGITAGNWYHIVFRFNGSGATDAEKLKYFVNGAQKTVVFYESPPTTTPNLGTSVGTFGSSISPFDGVMDQFLVNNTQFSNISTRYNMLFAPNTFFTIGTGVVTSKIVIFNTLSLNTGIIVDLI